jgi:sporulation protein YlmC with PRC-barrel domain
MVEDSLHGPTVLWGQLKGKKVKSNDGKDLGGIDKISQNYIKLEKGTIKKRKVLGP